MSRMQPKIKPAPTRLAGAHPSNPLRPKDWRWSRVIALHDKGADAYGEDALTRRGLDYYKLLRSSGDADEVQDELYARYSDIHMAYIEYERGSARRYMLEALIVGMVDAGDIARGQGVTVDMIQAYEDYFFDVRSRLHLDGFVTSELFGAAIVAGQPGKDCDFFWKRLGRTGGKKLLNAFWHLDIIEDEDSETLNKVIYSQIQRNALRASVSRPTSGPLAVNTIAEYAQLRAVEGTIKKVKGVGAGGDVESAAALREATYMLQATTSNPPQLLRASDVIASLADE